MGREQCLHPSCLPLSTAAMFVRCAASQLRLRRVPAVLERMSRARFATDALSTVEPAASKVGAHMPEQPQADTATVSTFTGTPKEMLDTRVVKIFKPAQGVQNATQNTLMWKIQWEDDRTERWSNPLMEYYLYPQYDYNVSAIFANSNLN